MSGEERYGVSLMLCTIAMCVLSRDSVFYELHKQSVSV